MELKYCAAPWRGLHVNLDGDVRVCCAGKPGMMGNINRHRIQDILQSPVLKEIRESIQQGHLHTEYCESCIHQDQSGNTERHWHNDVNPDFDPRKSIDDHKLTVIDIRWNNTCNFACTYCSPYFSSSWGQVQKESVRSTNRLYFDELSDYIVSNGQDLKDVAMLGGEPLLLNWNQKLIESLPPTTQITIITNLGTDLDNNVVFQALAQRKNVHWRVSLENIDDRFGYVRQNGSWATLLKNIEILQSLPGHRVGAHSIYHVYNCTRLCEFRTWAKDFFHHVQWQHIGQDYLDPRYHATRLRLMAKDEIYNLLKLDIDRDEHDFFSNILNTMHTHETDLGDVFKEHVVRDEKYFYNEKNNKFRMLWPELRWMIDGT